MRRRDGRAVARVVYRTEGSGNPPKSHTFAEIITPFADGSFLVSTSARAYLDAPTGVTLRAHVGAAAARLAASHDEALRDGSPRAAVSPSDSDASAATILARYHDVVRDRLLARGVFKPMSELDLDHATVLNQTHAAAASDRSFEFPEVLVELERLQKKSSNWGAGLAVLVVSLMLFIAAGRGSNAASTSGEPKWELALIIPILFVHELGHFIAMKVFGYRNVSMFFIPFPRRGGEGAELQRRGLEKDPRRADGPGCRAS